MRVADKLRDYFHKARNHILTLAKLGRPRAFKQEYSADPTLDLGKLSAELQQSATIDPMTKAILAQAFATPPAGTCSVRLTKLNLPFCPKPLLLGSANCYWHTENKEKYNEAIIEGHFGQGETLASALQSAVKRGVDLERAYLRDARFGGDFLRSGPDLSGARLWTADLAGAALSYSNLSRAVLNGANLTKARLGNAKLDGAYFYKARMFEIKLRNSSLSGAHGITQDNFRSPSARFFPIKRILEEYPDQAEPMYRELTKYFSTQALHDDASWAGGWPRHGFLSTEGAPFMTALPS